jgi:hypothetical protein
LGGLDEEELASRGDLWIIVGIDISHDRMSAETVTRWTY